MKSPSDDNAAGLGGAVRNMARRGHADAFIVTGDQPGSFSLVQSRVVTASGFVGAVMRVSAAIMVGFHGVISALRGARNGATACVRMTDASGAVQREYESYSAKPVSTEPD